MIRFTHILGSFRRRRSSLGRLVLVLFGLASLSAGAAPCVAMTASNPAAAQQYEASPTPAVSSHDHSHAMPHEHRASADDGERSPRACAHCPLTVAMSGSAASAHSFCSAGDDASDGGKPSASPAFKQLPLTAVIELLPVDREPRRSSSRQPPPEATTPSIALNLRHCVLLI